MPVEDGENETLTVHCFDALRDLPEQRSEDFENPLELSALSQSEESFNVYEPLLLIVKTVDVLLPTTTVPKFFEDGEIRIGLTAAFAGKTKRVVAQSSSRGSRKTEHGIDERGDCFMQNLLLGYKHTMELPRHNAGIIRLGFEEIDDPTGERRNRGGESVSLNRRGESIPRDISSPSRNIDSGYITLRRE